MMALFYTIFVLYIIFLILLLIGWERSVKQKVQADSTKVNVSVLIPLRNESANLPGIFDKLNKQNAAKDSFEVLFLDDHSEDDSMLVYKQHQQGLNFNHQWIRLPELEHGKKAALAWGINRAKYEVILTTDADVLPDATWVIIYQEVFSSQQIQFAFGLVSLTSGASFFEKMQQVEFASLMATAAASLYWNVPTMCNGANLAFRKEAYERAGGYSKHAHLASGDDEFLYHAIHKMFPDALMFVPNATVHTKAKTRLGELQAQRIRWASKWKHHPFFPMQALALFIFCFQLTWLSVPVLYALSPLNLNSVILWLGLKIFFEAVLLRSVIHHCKLKFNIPAFIALQLLYAPYVIISGVQATFSNYSWKGRSYTN
jgi:poly-beta-1,6-N-acetyl-D-glucosamine synthase